MEIEGSSSYAGIGSRKTPGSILDVMSKAAYYLAIKNWSLRSGGAQGADRAFEDAILCHDKLPRIDGRKATTGHHLTIYRSAHIKQAPENEKSEELNKIARTYNKGFDSKPLYVQGLLVRNVQIILGHYANNPVKFVVCWTPNAQPVGGTGMGIRIAEAHNIQVHNLADPDTLAKICKKVGAVVL